MLNMTERAIKHYMISDPVVLKENNTLKEIMHLMEEKHVSHLIIINDNEQLVGIISANDLLHRLQRISNQTAGKTYTNLELNSIKAKDIMTENPVFLQPNDSIEYASELLLQKKFHCLPVMQHKQAIGIVTQYDLLKAYYERNNNA